MMRSTIGGGVSVLVVVMLPSLAIGWMRTSVGGGVGGAGVVATTTGGATTGGVVVVGVTRHRPSGRTSQPSG